MKSRTLIAALGALVLASLAVPTSAFAAAPAPRQKGDLLVLAWSVAGDLALVQESVHRLDGAARVSFRVVGPGVMQKHYEIADDLGDFGGPKVQKVSAQDCRATLVALRDLLRAKRFKGVTLDGEACKTDRANVITVAPEQAEAADGAEAEPLPSGDGLEKGDWRMRLERDSLTLFGPKQAKKALKLPRPIAPESAHVLLSPSRKLLLVLQSIDGGDQILAAGFSSKTGEIADYE
ncbi:MAG: hypothetical protein QM765_45775 [Myxococcales bacterium]